MKNIKLKVNFTDKNYKSGTVVKVRCDDKGIPLSHFWRKRIKDAEIDNCVELIKPPKTVKARSDK